MTKIDLSRRSFLKSKAALVSTLALTSCATRGIVPVPKARRVGQKYNSRPEMMAIGDSLFQGVRSLSMAPDMAKSSPPALISVKLKKSFILPDYPITIGWNVEDIYKNRYPLFVEIPAFGRNLLTNFKSWDYATTENYLWSDHEAFDNISVGSATISDLWERKPGDADKRLRKRITDSRVEQFYSVPSEYWSDVWYDMNTSLTLNPSRRPEQDEKSQLQQVIDREPELLFVNIGSNEGLFSSCFLGHVGGAGFDVQRYEALLDELFMRLGDLSSRTKKIVFNSLVRPRTVPNLMPAADRIGSRPGDGYFDGYNANLFSERITITGQQLLDFDRVVQHVNDHARVALQKRLGKRGVFVDFFQASSTFDSKHYPDREIKVKELLLTNTPIEFNSDGSVSAGGLTGLDNMHPSGPGYATYANTILQAIGSPVITLDDRYQSYQSDRLMTVRARGTYRRAKEVRELVNLFTTLSKIVGSFT